MLAQNEVVYGECVPSLSGIRQARLYLAKTLMKNNPRMPNLSVHTTNRIILGFVEYTTNLIRHGDPSPLRIIYEVSLTDDGRMELHIWDDGGVFYEFNQRLIDQRRRPHHERGRGHHHGIYLLMRCFSAIKYLPRRQPAPFNCICLVADNG